MNTQVLRMLSIALAAGAILLGYLGLRLSAAPESQPVVAQQPNTDSEQPAHTVIISSRKIPAGTALEAGELTSIRVPVIRAGAFDAVDKLIGRVPMVPIAAGEILMESHFQAGSHLARLLAPGQRAVAIKVNEVIGGGGYVQPGDYVDVLLYLRGGGVEVKRSVARTLIERVAVLAYGDSLAVGSDGNILSAAADAGQSEASSHSAVLAVPRDQVERLMLGENAGVIRLSVVSSKEIASQESTKGYKSSPVELSEMTVRKSRPQAYRVPVYRGDKRTFEAASR